jgi:hypothetical protein
VRHDESLCATLRQKTPRKLPDGSRNFLGGKTDNREWPERLAQANLRVHRAPCGSTRASKATVSMRDVNMSGYPHPSGTR